MATVGKARDGRIVVKGAGHDCPPLEAPGYGLAFTPKEALALARDLRDAADPWSEEACIEWLRSHCALTVRLKGSEMRIIDRPDGLTDLREGVHELAAKRGIPCPLGDLCKVCHPPAPPVPSDEELAKMGTEELIGWIEGTGHSVLYVTTDDPASGGWSARRYAPHSHLKAASLLGLAKIVAMQLREAKPDE